MARFDTRAKDIRNLPGVGLTAALAVAFLYAPILFLVLYSFNDGRSISRLDGLSFRWYAAVFANEEIGGAALNSVLLAVIAASLATVMATAAALAMVRMRVRRRASAHAVLNFPLMVPEIVTAIASLIFFSSIGLGLGFGSLVIAHTTFCIPFAYLPIAARLTSMDPGLEAALHLFWLNRGVLVTPFHDMLLVPPMAAEADLEAAVRALHDFVEALT